MRKTALFEGETMTVEQLSHEWDKIRAKYDDECLMLGRAIVESFSRLKHAEELQNRMRNCLDLMAALREVEKENEQKTSD